MAREDRIFLTGCGLFLSTAVVIVVFGKDSPVSFLYGVGSIGVLGYGYYLKSKVMKKDEEKIAAKQILDYKGKEVERLNQLLEDKIITQEQYDSKKSEIKESLEGYKDKYFGS